MERRETESMELSKAEAVTVWYGSIVSRQQLNSTGDLFNFQKQRIKNELSRCVIDVSESLKEDFTVFT